MYLNICWSMSLSSTGMVYIHCTYGVWKKSHKQTLWVMTLALPRSTLGKLLIAWFGRIWYSNAKLSAAHCATSAFTLWFANFISRMKNMTTLALIFLSQAYSLFAPKPLGQKMSKPLGLNFQTPWIKFPNPRAISIYDISICYNQQLKPTVITNS